MTHLSLMELHEERNSARRDREVPSPECNETPLIGHFFDHQAPLVYPLVVDTLAVDCSCAGGC